MSDILNRIREQQDVFTNLMSKIPGFTGYVDRENRRAADKLLRENIANRYEEIWRRISSMQQDLIREGGLAQVGELERAAIKLRQFIDRIRTASYGYAGFFDAVKINSAELEQIYQYDLWMLSLVDELNKAADNVEASFGTDGVTAAIRNLTRLSQEAVEAFNRRSSVITGGADAKTDQTSPTNLPNQ